MTNKRNSVFILCLFLLAGCVSVQETPEPDELIPQQAQTGEQPKEAVLETQSVSEEDQGPEALVEEKGVIFAKTDFQGLLEARYVRFLFEDLDDPLHKFQLQIGENADQQSFPWEVKTVRPGYFFVELPAGRYRIASVTIPVGSTTATEPMNVRLEVMPDAVCYVGTLHMNGTKEKVKLGGLTDLPVIKPGFEFTVDVLDEREEGAEAFQKNYPDFPGGVSIRLMEVGDILSESKGQETDTIQDLP